MSTCWKCGAICADGMECEACQGATVQPKGVQPLDPRYQVDPAKIRTIEDVADIIGAIGIGVRPGTPAFEKLKHLLKGLLK